MSRSNITAIIPARSGSKGLLGKNTALLAGQDLYMYSVDVARATGIKNIVISTDIEFILNADDGPDVRAIKRSSELAGDDVVMIDVLLDYFDHHDAKGVFVLLQPTSPLRRPDQVEAAIDLYLTGEFDMVMSVSAKERTILKAGLMVGDHYRPINDPAFTFANRQSLPDVVSHNGAIYVFGAEWLRQNRGFESDKIGVILMDKDSAVDIDRPEDLKRAEAILAHRGI